MVSSRPAVHYVLSNYVSHRVSGLANRRALVEAGFVLVESPRSADIVIIHDEPPVYSTYFRAHPSLGEKYVVACAVWETDRLPDHWRFSLELVDEVWTPSAHSRAAAMGATDRVVVVPYVVDPPAPAPIAVSELRHQLGRSSQSFKFYAIDASLNGSNPRKNLAGLIEAFDGLFAPAEDVALIVKTRVPLPRSLSSIAGVINLSGFSPDRGPVEALHRLADCLVSPHCGEGWGLSMSDAMAAGKLVVATGYSGNMEFMNSDNSVLVSYSVEPVSPAQIAASPLLNSSMRWAKVDGADLRAKLRWTHDNWPELRHLRERARADMAEFSSARVGALMAARLEEIARRLGC